MPDPFELDAVEPDEEEGFALQLPVDVASVHLLPFDPWLIF